MPQRYWVLSIALIGILSYLCRPAAPSSADTLAARPSSLAARFVGAGSCAASNCHNGNFAHGPSAGSEYTFWITRDPHARAYEVLFAERSRQIQKNLGRTAPAHEEQRCLSCHVAPDYDAQKPPPDAPHLKRDGVSCESCHGPARDWLPLHRLDGWRAKSATEKQALGMTDTRSLVGRAKLCVRCHVGAPGLDVDHDLLAAGHPRLHFEFAAFHAHLPRHWPDARDRVGRPDFEAQVWAVGQLVSTQAALDLLMDRAADKKKPWPEFAEHDCAACHHDLKASVRKIDSRRGTGLAWNESASLMPNALEILRLPAEATKMRTAMAALRTAMNKPGTPNRAEIVQLAKSAALLLNPLTRNLERQRPAELRVQEALPSLLAEDYRSNINGATQRDLAIIALWRAGRDRKAMFPAQLQTHMRKHAIGPATVSEPEAIRQRLLDAKNLGFEKGPVK